MKKIGYQLNRPSPGSAKTSSKKRRPLAILAIIAVLLVAGGVFYWVTRPEKASVMPPAESTDKTVNTIVPQGPSQAEKDEVERNKVDDPTAPREEDKDNPATPPPAPTPPAASASVQISSAKQEGDNVVIQTALHGNGWSKCTLTVTNGGTKTYDANVLYQETFSTCMGFAIPKTDLPAGNWNISLRAYNTDGSDATSETKTVKVQ